MIPVTVRVEALLFHPNSFMRSVTFALCCPLECPWPCLSNPLNQFYPLRSFPYGSSGCFHGSPQPHPRLVCTRCRRRLIIVRIYAMTPTRFLTSAGMIVTLGKRDAWHIDVLCDTSSLGICVLDYVSCPSSASGVVLALQRRSNGRDQRW